ncbi:FxLYD domain-containing protein [Brevundimonas sp.]|uniref:FxLYD domain-containing protein n=1 Tax=Brevundimonas sp. TaxID=1871086 RepID=UPI002EDBA588
MENSAGAAASSRAGRGWLAPAGTVAALMAIGLPLYVIEATDDRDKVVLTRNEAIGEPLGGRTWRGGLANATDRALTDVSVQIRFHDRAGRPVGAPVSARAARLGPGARLDLQARLPAAAAGLQIWALRWTGEGGETVGLGPYERWTFGHVQV